MGESVLERHYKAREEFIQRNLTGKLLVKSTDREWENTKQGRLKFYLYPKVLSDTALQEWHILIQDLQSHSGKHRHQGGLVIFVIEGRGYTVIDGIRRDWKKGDLILLPLKPNGIEHQHFNLEPGTKCRWMAFVYVPMYDQVASYSKQIESLPGQEK